MIGLGVEILNQQKRQQQQQQRQKQQQQPRATQKQRQTQQTPSKPRPDPAKAARRAEVLEMQAHLNRLGYDAGPVDGIPGARTRAALSAFERDHGLAPDGKLDAAALAVLRTSTKPKQDYQTTTDHSQTTQAPLVLSQGSHGAIDPQSGLRLPSPARLGDAVLTGWPVSWGPLAKQTVKLGPRDVNAASLDLASYVDLHILKSFPTIMTDEKIAAEYAGRFLGGDLQNRYHTQCRYPCDRQAPYSGWQGATEFERQATYQAFVQEIVPELVSHAPEFPIQTTEVDQVKLGQYDQATQSFPLYAVRPRTGYFGYVKSITTKAGKISGPKLDHLPMDPETAESLAAQFGAQERVLYIGYDQTVGPATIWPYGAHNYELPIQVTGLRVALDPELHEVIYSHSETDKPATDVTVRDGVVWAMGRVVLPATQLNITSPAPLKKNLWAALKPRVASLVDVSGLPDHVVLERLPELNLSQPELRQLAATALGRDPTPEEFNDLLRDGARSHHFRDPFVQYRLVGGIKTHLENRRPQGEENDTAIPLRVYCESNLQTYDFASAAFPLKPNCRRHFMEITHDLAALGITSASPLNFDAASIFPSALPMPMQEAEAFSKTAGTPLMSFETDLSLSARQTDAGPVLTLSTTPPRNLRFHPQADLAAASLPLGSGEASAKTATETSRVWQASDPQAMENLASIPTETHALPMDAGQLHPGEVLGRLQISLYGLRQEQMGDVSPLSQRAKMMQRRNGDLAAPLGVSSDRLISVAEDTQGRYAIYGLLPAPADSYRVTLPTDGYGRSQLELRTELDITNAITLRLADNREALLLLLTPTVVMATERHNGPVIDRFKLATPDTALTAVSRLETPPRYILLRNLAARFAIDAAPVLENSLSHPSELSIHDKRARYEDSDRQAR
ncbi:peptidoglycan-binding domain-containing protein [Roseovarius sp. C7]|uniref:peptidoglycan-binding domain-containing protein n=1 Tax=Roseovarius sp. C7 TaxID=3398643 RepID=UPI0039F6F42E